MTHHTFLLFSLLVTTVSAFTLQYHVGILKKLQHCPIDAQQSRRWSLITRINNDIINDNSRVLSSRMKSSKLSADVKDNNTSNLDKTKDSNDEEEWEFEEYEDLNETDFYDSEWKVGTLMEGSKKMAFSKQAATNSTFLFSDDPIRLCRQAPAVSKVWR